MDFIALWDEALHCISTNQWTIAMMIAGSLFVILSLAAGRYLAARYTDQRKEPEAAHLPEKETQESPEQNDK